MQKTGFDSRKYVEEQSRYILERVRNSSGRLYIECGGKLLHDKHASRVLPGFDENNKMKVFQSLKDKLDIIICIYAGDIEKRKIRSDFGISYDADVLKMIDDFASYGLICNKVVITRYEDQVGATVFKEKLERRGINVYTHPKTPGYPANIDVVVSENGYGKNEYIPVDAPVVIVTAPGEASAHLAATLGNKFSVIVGRKKWIPQMEENIHKYGLGRKLASFRSLDLGVLEFHENEDKTRRRMEEEIRKAVEEDQAEVIVLGCTMQFGFYREMQEKFQIPVIDSMVAAVKYAEYLVEMREKAGWTFSRAGLYERPPVEEMKAWELEKVCDLEGLLYEEGERR